MNGNNTARFARAAMGLVLAVCALAPVRAAPSEQHQVIDHIATYLGVLSAEMILGLHGDHVEETMHDGRQRADTATTWWSRSSKA